MGGNAVTVESFVLRLYRGRAATGDPELSVSGNGEEWKDYLRVRVPGFDGAVSVSLENFWSAVLGQRLESAESEVTGLETIVKFGGTMQLKETFTAVIEVAYA